jgi:hypothetical protein
MEVGEEEAEGRLDSCMSRVSSTEGPASFDLQDESNDDHDWYSDGGGNLDSNCDVIDPRIVLEVDVDVDKRRGTDDDTDDAGMGEEIEERLDGETEEEKEDILYEEGKEDLLPFGNLGDAVLAFLVQYANEKLWTGDMQIPAGLTSAERKEVHEAAEELGLKHYTTGKGQYCAMVISKPHNYHKGDVGGDASKGGAGAGAPPPAGSPAAKDWMEVKIKYDIYHWMGR